MPQPWPPSRFVDNTGVGAAGKQKGVETEVAALATTEVEPLYTMAEMRANLSLLRGAMRHRGGKRKLDEVSIQLPLYVQLTTTAATDFTTVTTVAGWQAATEWASLATLYEEYIIDSFDLVFSAAYVAGYTTSTPGLWVFAYDPMSNAVLGSIANGFQHSQKFVFGMSVDSGRAPIAVAKDGAFHWRVRIPPKVASSTADANVRGHEWTSTSDTTTNYGYIKPFFPVLGATGTHRISCMLNMHCRFRSRT